MTYESANLWCIENGVDISTRGEGWGTLSLDYCGLTVRQVLPDPTFDTFSNTFVWLVRRLRAAMKTGRALASDSLSA